MSDFLDPELNGEAQALNPYNDASRSQDVLQTEPAAPFNPYNDASRSQDTLQNNNANANQPGPTGYIPGTGAGLDNATGLNALLRAITGGSLGASTAGGNSAVNGIGGLLAAYMLSKALKGDSGPQYGGYKGSVNMGMQMNRQQLPPPATTQSFNAAGQAAPARRPGSARGNYFTQPVFAAQGGLMPGGIANVAPPGYAVGGTLLRGPGDGLSDSIHATIDGKQPARLADGEFVVPADVVSALGNGSTEAGSRSLYAMMDRVRQHAHGKKTQQRAVKPNKVLPA